RLKKAERPRRMERDATARPHPQIQMQERLGETALSLAVEPRLGGKPQNAPSELAFGFGL
ncbi:MAG: hypothetical protein KC492_41095, partial [Myxococcales bacterium]|nr:hypothetical protein [Myxococcales bacterium]